MEMYGSPMECLGLVSFSGTFFGTSRFRDTSGEDLVLRGLRGRARALQNLSLSDVSLSLIAHQGMPRRPED